MSTSVTNILDMPDEILVKILLHFDVRERPALAHSCKRFNDLVYGDKDMLRNLDFSKRPDMITAKDIEQYFSKETTLKYLRRVNVEEVECVKAGKMLNNSIGRALNLVDINICGTKFKNLKQLESFLEPLIHIKRLSFLWPDSIKDTCSVIIQETFRRLTHLSVVVPENSLNFFVTLPLCQKLEELRVWIGSYKFENLDIFGSVKPNKLINLKSLHIHDEITSERLRNYFIGLLPDLHEWTILRYLLDNERLSVHLEKNVQVCDELRRTKFMEAIPEHWQDRAYNCGSFVSSDYLLKEIIKINYEDVPENLCSLSSPDEHASPDAYDDEYGEQCILDIDEAKELLKDPGYQISFLRLAHTITTNCDAHLIASAFPNLTKLYLSDIIRNADTERSAPRQKKHYQRRLRRRDSIAPEEPDDPMNFDSSFKMLVENTPHVRDLTIWMTSRSPDGEGPWDLDALDLIPLWKNLRALKLGEIPVENGKFLINVAKECPQLEIIDFQDLGNRTEDCCYENDLLEMLSHLKNLKEVEISGYHIPDMVSIFILLANNPNLRSVTIGDHCYKGDHEIFISPIEQLFCRCTKLTEFSFYTSDECPDSREELVSALLKIKKQLHRSELWITKFKIL